jgi:hypothetical protein
MDHNQRERGPQGIPAPDHRQVEHERREQQRHRNK